LNGISLNILLQAILVPLVFSFEDYISIFTTGW